MNTLRTAVQHWVTFGALTGGAISGFDKCVKICDEPEPVYKNPIFERPIQMVYHVSRIAGHAGFGSAIGGFTALTAPVSVPAYIYWQKRSE